MKELPFAKFDAAGNTWIVLAGDSLKPSLFRAARSGTARLARLARRLCRSGGGTGSDGLILILPPADAKNLALVRFFNADGSEAEMSGNGIRCAAAWFSAKRTRSLRFETRAGLRIATAQRRRKGEPEAERYLVRMGRPVLDPKDVPFTPCGLGRNPRGPIVDYPLATSHGIIRVTVTSMGNPHCSIFGFDKWKKLGREIEVHRSFPNRTNVEFVRVLSRRKIEVRFWERGVGLTLSSGTGSCAAVVACALAGRTGRRVTVRTGAASLEVAWRRDGEVWLTGPVRLVGHGRVLFG